MVAIATDNYFSSEDSGRIDDLAGSLDGLSAEIERALDLAIWAFDFQGDLEDALDGAFLRSVLAGTPTLTGGLLTNAA
jgi:hypothetical protein